MSMLDLDSLREGLCDTFPAWSRWIAGVRIDESPKALPVDNDGRGIFYNQRLMRYYTPETQRFYLAQQLLHLRLNHYERGRGRDRIAWKRASDAVVNQMLRREGLQVPMDAVLVPAAEEKSAEELYEIFLLNREREKPLLTEEEDQLPAPVPKKKDRKAGKGTEGGRREIEDPGLAVAVKGLSSMLEPSLQTDYDWFPGNVIRDGMLPYQFRPYPVAYAEVLLDTSASVEPELLRAFVKGVKGLMQEDAVLRVGCFDTRFYGFREIRTEKDIDALELRGAGGTNFTVAINAFTGDAENQIVFTDGYAEMPEQRCDAIWVVYGNMPIHPLGGRVIYAKRPEEKEKYEIDFLIT